MYYALSAVLILNKIKHYLLKTSNFNFNLKLIRFIEIIEKSKQYKYRSKDDSFYNKIHTFNISHTHLISIVRN